MVGQTILAFHEDCVIAYNGKKRIWDEDKIYSQVFADQLTAEHIIFVYSLSKSIDELKNQLRRKKKSRTDSEEKEMKFLSARGSKMLMIATISACLEDLMCTKISDKWKLKFKDNSDLDRLINMWLKVVSSIVPFHQNLDPALEGGLKNKELAYKQISYTKSSVAAIKEMLAEKLKDVLDEREVEET